MSNSFGQTSLGRECLCDQAPGPKFPQDLLRRKNLKLNPCQYHNIWKILEIRFIDIGCA